MVGWFEKKRWLRNYVRLMRRSGSPEYVARGVAVGLFCAFVTPLFQMPLALILALWVRGSRFAALLFTWVSNPLTIPLIYPFQCVVGGWLLGKPSEFHSASSALSGLVEEHSIPAFLRLEEGMLWRFFIGGIVLGLCSALVGYPVFKGAAQRFQQRRARRIARRLKV
jgi:uncharacterized protein (DUF2062 family)